MQNMVQFHFTPRSISTFNFLNFQMLIPFIFFGGGRGGGFRKIRNKVQIPLCQNRLR